MSKDKKVIGATVVITKDGESQNLPTVGLDVPGASWTHHSNPPKYYHLTIIQGKLFKMVSEKEPTITELFTITSLEDMEEIEQIDKPVKINLIASNGETAILSVTPTYEK